MAPDGYHANTDTSGPAASWADRSDDRRTPDEAKQERAVESFGCPFQTRPSRTKNKPPLAMRAAKRHRRNKLAKLHRKAIAIALATKRNRGGA